MTQTEFLEAFKRAAKLQAEKKKAQQERFMALVEKMKSMNKPKD